MIQMGMRLLREYQGEDDRTVALLNALRPFLKESRLAKLDRAVQISRLARVIRVLFRGMGEGGGAMYNRYIPQNGTYTRVVEQDGPEEGPGVRRPIRPGREGGERAPGLRRTSTRGSPGRARREEAAGLPRVPWALAAWGTCSQGEKSPLNALFGGDKGGINGILKVLRLEELDSGDILLILIILLLLVEGGQHGPGHHPGAAAPAGAGG